MLALRQQIDDAERRDAEIRYVRKLLSNLGKDWQGNAVQETHPRLRELKDLYDISIEETTPSFSQPITMGASMLTVTFICIGKGGHSSCVGFYLPLIRFLQLSFDAALQILLPREFPHRFLWEK